MTEANQPVRTKPSARKRGLSITLKLIALIVVTSGTLVVALSSYFLSQQLQESRAALERKAMTYGRLVAKEVASAIAFSDQETAREVFSSVAQDRDIDSLVLMTSNGDILYAHGAPGAWIADAKGGVVEQRLLDLGERIAIVAPVVSAEGPRGTLVLEVSTRALAETNQRLMRTALIAVCVALLLGAFVAYVIARSFGNRIGSIARVATEITQGELAHDPVKVSGSDEIAVLGHAFNAMLAHIQSLVQQIKKNAEDEHARLEGQVRDRTRELAQRNDDMRLVLNNVDQGFMGVDLHGKIAAERSAIVTRWLGEARSDETLFTYIERNFPGKGDFFRVGWDSLSEDWMPLEMRLDQLPREVQTPEQCFAFSYKPVFVGETLHKLLVVITDITALLAQRRAEEEEHELAQVVRKLLEDRNGFEEFVHEADEIVSGLETQGGEWQHMRLLHTLKGNSAIFGFASLSRLCHELETAVQERQSGANAPELALLRTTWKRLKDKIGALTETRPDTLEVSNLEFKELLSRVDSHAPPNQLRALLETWKLAPVEPRLTRLADYARVLADRLDKNPIEIKLESNGVRLDPHAWTQVWQAVVHVVRNAVDHGLESPEERAAKHKSVTGVLVFRTERTGSMFSLTIEDHGRGIDWALVKQAAAKRGLPHDTQDELQAALLADGLSTRETVTSTSGRGVGLSAVQQVCAQTGGRLRITSDPGLGTRFLFEWTIDAAYRPLGPRFSLPANDLSPKAVIEPKYAHI